MSSGLTESAARGSLGGAAQRGERIAAYIELGKLRIVELWAGIPLAWTLLDPDARMTGRRCARRRRSR